MALKRTVCNEVVIRGREEIRGKEEMDMVKSNPMKRQ